jgi:hypothetical protein
MTVLMTALMTVLMTVLMTALRAMAVLMTVHVFMGEKKKCHSANLKKMS